MSNSSPHVVWPTSCLPIIVGHTNNEMVRRLKILAEALQAMDQGEENATKYTDLAGHMAQEAFLSSGSREVRVLLACCIADFFRICSPECPYGDPSQLKAVLEFVVKTLRGLDTPRDPHYSRYYYLLENLVMVGSLNLILELPDEDQQVVLKHLIKSAFGVVQKSEAVDSKVESLLMELIVPVLANVDQISPKVLDAIFYNVVNPQKSQNPPAYAMASQLIQKCQSALEHYVQQFLVQSLLTGAMADCDMVGQNKLYDLIFELHAIAPDMLYPVISQLQYKFQSEDDRDREQATRLAGRLIAVPGSTLAEECVSLWNGYLGRFHDRRAEIRLHCVQEAKEILVNQPALRGQLSEKLVDRSHDTEEEIRLEVMKSIASAARKKLDCVNESLLQCMAERGRDKKYRVRKEALLNLGTLYKRVLCSDQFSESERESMAWIRERLLYIYYQQSLDDKLLVEKLVSACVIPFSLEVNQRMNVLFNTYCQLDDTSIKPFDEIMKAQTRVRKCVRHLLELHMSEETEHRTEQILLALRQIASLHPDANRVFESLKQFYQFMADKTFAFERMEYIVGTEYTTKGIHDAVTEVLGKYDTDNQHVKTLLERISPLLIDSEAIEILLDVVAEKAVPDSEASVNLPKGVDQVVCTVRAFRLLRLLAENFPHCFRSEKTLNHLKDFVANHSNHQVICRVSITILSLALAESEGKFAKFVDELLPVLEKIATSSNAKAAKHAVRCIGKLTENGGNGCSSGDGNKQNNGNDERRTEHFERIFKASADHVQLDDRCAPAALAVLGEIALSHATQFRAEYQQLIKESVVNNILLSSVTHDVNNQRDLKSFADDAELSPQCRTKLAGMKCFVRYLRGVRNNDDLLVEKALTLFTAIVECSGDVHQEELKKTGIISEAEKARMRLMAGCSVLKLAEENKYQPIISHKHFQITANLIIDDCVEVRTRFVLRLHVGLKRYSLPLDYMGMFSLVQLLTGDGNKQFKSQVRNCAIANYNSRKALIKKKKPGATVASYLPEYSVAYATHLLSHNKLFTAPDDVEALMKLKECVWFLLEVFHSQKDVNGTDYNFLYNMFQEVKNSVDRQDIEDGAEADRLEQNKVIDDEQKRFSAGKKHQHHHLFNRAVPSLEQTLQVQQSTSTSKRTKVAKNPAVGRAATKRRRQPSSAGSDNEAEISVDVSHVEEISPPPKKKQPRKLPRDRQTKAEEEIKSPSRRSVATPNQPSSSAAVSSARRQSRQSSSVSPSKSKRQSSQSSSVVSPSKRHQSSSVSPSKRQSSQSSSVVSPSKRHQSYSVSSPTKRLSASPEKTKQSSSSPTKKSVDSSKKKKLTAKSKASKGKKKIVSKLAGSKRGAAGSSADGGEEERSEQSGSSDEPEPEVQSPSHTPSPSPSPTAKKSRGKPSLSPVKTTRARGKGASTPTTKSPAKKKNNKQSDATASNNNNKSNKANTKKQKTPGSQKSTSGSGGQKGKGKPASTPGTSSRGKGSSLSPSPGRVQPRRAAKPTAGKT